MKTLRMRAAAVRLLFVVPILLLAAPAGFSDTSIRHAAPDTRTASAAPVETEDPEEVRRATGLLHVTGVPQDVNIFTWRLKVTGRGVDTPLMLTYGDLKEMETVEKDVVLVCPGVFTDRADWEGVPLEDVLARADIRDDYETVLIHGLDGYQVTFTREEIDDHLLFLALKVNGVTLPKEHGFPIRLVAEDMMGGFWVKWIDFIEVK